MNPMRSSLICLAGAALLVHLTGCAGFVGSTLPPKISPAERQSIKTVKLPMTVGVIRGKPGADLVRSQLQRIRLFDRVDFADQLPHPDLIAEFEQVPYGTSAIPFVTMLSLGIIPSTIKEPIGFACSFHPPASPEQKLKVEYSFDSKTILGWVTLPLVVIPGWVFPYPSVETRDRFLDHFKLAMVQRAGELKALAGKPPESQAGNPAPRSPEH